METKPPSHSRRNPPPPPAPAPGKSSPPGWNPLSGDALLCDHLGLLVFANALSTISQATSPPEPLLAQWLGSVLPGARNIEQTKYLNWQDLGTILGQTVRFPTSQREQLTRLATPSTIAAVLRWNYQQHDLPAEDGDFYDDPHTAHYTGTQNILKGWCASIRWADKLINSDYIHTAAGHPSTSNAPTASMTCADGSSPSWTPSKSAPETCFTGSSRPSKPPTTITATITTTSAS